jgi:predicted outer membrane repeat protein
MKGGALILTLAVWLTSAHPARGYAVVTLCHSSNEAGPGVNLETALFAPPDPNTLINTIKFQCNGSATIQVRQVFIDQPTSIDGGNQITLVNAPGNFSMFAVNGTLLYLHNLVLQNTSVPSGECWTNLQHCNGSVVLGVVGRGEPQGSPTVELHHCTVQNSVTPISMLSGSLSVFDSQFTGNSQAVIVAEGPATVAVARSTFQSNSGAAPIEAIGNVNITNSQFINNKATVITGAACKVSVDRSTFAGNNVNGALEVNCDATITHSVFKDNGGTEGGGGAIRFGASGNVILLRSDTFVNNSGFRGGAVGCYWAPLTSANRTLTVLYSTFKGNKATSGGAIEVGNNLTASLGSAKINVGITSFSGNVATADGGAISATASELDTARVGFADNTAGGNGGAVFMSNPTAQHSILANTLFVRNKARTGSAFFGDDADFIYSTVDSNVGPAIAVNTQGTAAHIRLSNSIVSNNSQGCVPTPLFDDASSGHNLQFPGTDCGPTITVANPNLDTMYIPTQRSLALGNGDHTTCMSPPVNGRDVYGSGRPSGGVCTIGAAEGDIAVAVSQLTRKGRDDTLLKAAVQDYLQRDQPGHK